MDLLTKIVAHGHAHGHAHVHTRCHARGHARGPARGPARPSQYLTTTDVSVSTSCIGCAMEQYAVAMGDDDVLVVRCEVGPIRYICGGGGQCRF